MRGRPVAAQASHSGRTIARERGGVTFGKLPAARPATGALTGRVCNCCCPLKPNRPASRPCWPLRGDPGPAGLLRAQRGAHSGRLRRLVGGVNRPVDRWPSAPKRPIRRCRGMGSTPIKPLRESNKVDMPTSYGPSCTVKSPPRERGASGWVGQKTVAAGG